jgi:hypothetical protein
MSIVFDQIEGVVQKAEATPPADTGASPSPAAQKPPHEAFEDARRRMERHARRLHAD